MASLRGEKKRSNLYDNICTFQVMLKKVADESVSYFYKDYCLTVHHHLYVFQKD